VTKSEVDRTRKAVAETARGVKIQTKGGNKPVVNMSSGHWNGEERQNHSGQTDMKIGAGGDEKDLDTPDRRIGRYKELWRARKDLAIENEFSGESGR